MNDGVLQGLVEGACAAPLEDAPRWVLADYLESVGQVDRARFVRLQLEQARLERWDPQRVRNRVEQRALLQAHGEGWRAELPVLEGVVWGRFERGLVSRVAFADLAALTAHGEAARRATPVSHLFLRWPRLEHRVELAAMPGLEELTVVGTLIGPDDLAWLANSPLLSTIRALNLVETQMEAEALRQLLASPHLARLEALRLPSHDLGNQGVELLVQASLPNLVDLDLSVPSLDDLGSGGRYLPTMDRDGAEALARWPGLARLHTLDLTGNQVQPEGLAALLSAPGAAGLRTLRIRSTADWDWEGDGERPDVLVALASSTDGMRLDELDISECPLTEASGPALAGAPALAELKVLRFDYTQGSFEQVVQAPWAESLRVLSAVNCGQDGVQAILSRAFPRLHTLDLSTTYAWAQAGMSELLRQAPPQPALLELTLSEADLTDGDLEVLGEVTSLPALLSLDLRGEWDVDFSEDAARQFAASPLGARLESLALGVPGVDRAPEPPPVAVGQGEYRGPLRHL